MADWHSVEGWFSDADAEALRGLLKRVPEGGTTAHVGIFQGRHLAACADVLRGRGLSVLAVDTWRGSDGGVVLVGSGEAANPHRLLKEDINWPAVAINFGRVTATFDLGGEMEVMAVSSLYAACRCRVRGKSFDLVFLDADHQQECVAADILAWKPLLKPGGILCGHDWDNPDYPGVVKAVWGMLPDAQCVADSTVWFWRAPS